MSGKTRYRPTEAELAILGVLWRLGPSSVREVRDALGADRDVGYTTVLKTLQIMGAKGLVERDASMRSHRFWAAQSKEDTRQRLVQDLVERAFSGDAEELIAQTVLAFAGSPVEFDAIRRRIDELEGSCAAKLEQVSAG